MKLLILSILLLATSLPSPATSQSLNPAVLDTDSQVLVIGQEYFIVPLKPGHGGGLALELSPNNTCPTYVVQENYEASFGFPVIFSPMNKLDLVVRESTDVNVLFSIGGATQCGQSVVWMLRFSGQTEPETLIEIGGQMGAPPSVPNVWFKLVKYGIGGAMNYYKLAFCPPTCNWCDKNVCQELGIHTIDGRRWLGLGGENFPVMFKRVIR